MSRSGFLLDKRNHFIYIMETLDNKAMTGAVSG